MFAKTPEPPYCAVMFSSLRADDGAGYDAMSETMAELAMQQPGYLGIESARGEDGFGITVSYWANMDDVKRWKAQAQHQIAQRLGIERWYDHYEVRVARVERAYRGPRKA